MLKLNYFLCTLESTFKVMVLIISAIKLVEMTNPLILTLFRVFRLDSSYNENKKYFDFHKTCKEERCNVFFVLNLKTKGDRPCSIGMSTVDFI